MEAYSNCIPFTPRDADAMREQLRDAVLLEDLAECLYETCVLCDRLGDRPWSWDQLPQSMKARYRFIVEDAFNKAVLAHPTQES